MLTDAGSECGGLFVSVYDKYIAISRAGVRTNHSAVAVCGGRGVRRRRQQRQQTHTSHHHLGSALIPPTSCVRRVDGVWQVICCWTLAFLLLALRTDDSDEEISWEKDTRGLTTRQSAQHVRACVSRRAVEDPSHTWFRSIRLAMVL